MPCPCKQADAHLLFEPGYLFGDRRLRDLESIGGATEIELLGHDHEISEVPKLNISVANTIRQGGAASRSPFSCNSHLCYRHLNCCTLERTDAARSLHDFVTPHPIWEHCLLPRYFVRDLNFPQN